MMPDPCLIEQQPLRTLSQALEILQQTIQAVEETQCISIDQAQGRVLANTVFSPRSIPAFRNAAMDGYAFSSQGKTQQPFTLSLAGSAYAGHPYIGAVDSTQCLRIMTGAVLPDELDSVVMQEKVHLQGQDVYFPANVTLGDNVREIGEDIVKGDLVLAANTLLSSRDIALLASLGIEHITVFRALRIAIFSSGDELQPVGSTLCVGHIYDSNRYLLRGLLTSPNYLITDMGIVNDDAQLLRQSLLKASKDHDVIITTGGASVGEADHVNAVLQSCGTMHFWKLAMKPGKPFSFGRIAQCYFFGLPGNPVAVMATFTQLVRPSLEQLSGGIASKPLRFPVISGDQLRKLPGREEFQRGILYRDEHNALRVKSAGGQGSHMLASLSKANCLIVLPANCSGIAVGEEVIVEPFC